MYQDSDYKGRDKEFVSRHNTWNAQERAKPPPISSVVRMTIAVFLGLTSLLGFILFSSSSEVELLAQQQGTISIVRATALPLVNSEGSQVKVVINYSMGSESFLGPRMNAVWVFTIE